MVTGQKKCLSLVKTTKKSQKAHNTGRHVLLHTSCSSSLSAAARRPSSPVAGRRAYNRQQQHDDRAHRSQADGYTIVSSSTTTELTGRGPTGIQTLNPESLPPGFSKLCVKMFWSSRCCPVCRSFAFYMPMGDHISATQLSTCHESPYSAEKSLCSSSVFTGLQQLNPGTSTLDTLNLNP